MRQPARLSEVVLRTFDLAILALALPLAHSVLELAMGPRAAPVSIETLWPPVALVLLLWVGASRTFAVYDQFRTRRIAVELARVAKATAAVGLLMTSLAFALEAYQFSRGLVGLYFALAFLLIATSRLLLRKLLRFARSRGHNARIYAVVGAGDLAGDVVAAMAAHPEWGFQLAGYILEEGVPAAPRGRVLGWLSQLGELLENNVLDEVIFAVPRERLGTIEEPVRICEEQGVKVRMSLDLFRDGLGRMSLEDLDGHSMLVLTRVPEDALALAAKRMFDVVLSAALLILLLPLLGALALAIRLDSPGPIFFRQRRVGLNGRSFAMLKFRSMHVGAEARLELLRASNEMSGPVFKMKNDPRVTRVGRFMRRTSLDELPQFWNVLRGEMSVVGPRPPVPAEVRQYKRWQRRRLSVKPGITCTWQVSGRNDIDFERWMELDLEYIDHWSLWRDFEICLKTIPAVIAARGAR